MMEGLFRKIAIYLCKPIYCLIVYMYKIFYNIATTRFLQSEIVQEISANIYTLVSVVMLFAFSVTILSAIVNPDLLSDGKKGVKAVFKRAIIALMLIVVIPFAFDELYKIQETIMKNSLIEKIVVGIEYNCNSSDKSKCEAGGNGGQVIAGTLMSAVLYLDDEMADADGNVNVSVSVSEYYSKMIAEDLPKYIGAVAKNINATAINPENANISNDEAYAFKFNGLIAIVVGLVTVYILVIFAIDVAVRVFKMAFMELTAPISIVSYVAAGDKILSSWFKELGKTYAELFVRVAAIAFYLFLVSNLSSFMEQFKNSDWTLVLKAFLMVGMLIFAKQVPDMIGKIFGVEIKSQGGIAGRLGNMAGVGNVAKKAWEAVRNPIAAAAGVGSMALGTGAHIASAARTSFNNGKKAVQRIRADGKKHGIKTAGAVASAIGSGLWGASFGSVSAAARSLKNGVNNKNLHSMKDEYDLYKDTHKEGSTVVGRTIDDIRRGTGFKSRADTKGEANEHLTNTASALNNMHSKAKELLSQEDSTRIVYTVKDAAGNVMLDSHGNPMSMNLHDATEYLETLRNSAPVASDFKDATGSVNTDAFNKALAKHQQQIINVTREIRNQSEIQEKDIINSALNGTLNGTAAEIETSNELNNEFNTIGKEYKKTGDPNVSSLSVDRATFSADMDNFEKAVNTAIGENTSERDSAGNLTKYGRQKADSDSINNRPGNKSGGSSSGKDSGSSK